jgi:hypothetical protein
MLPGEGFRCSVDGATPPVVTAIAAVAANLNFIVLFREHEKVTVPSEGFFG